MAFTYVTITHIYETAADTPAAGFVDFTPVKPMHNGLTVVQKTISAPLSVSGAMSQLLAANTDPDTTPTGTTYEVTERITGQPKISYFVQVPHDQGASLDIRSLAGWAGATGGGGGGGGGSGVLSVNSELPDGSGNIVVSAADLGAQPADADLTGLAALADGYPRRASGAWAVRTAAQLGVDLATAPTPITLTASAGVITPNAALGAGPHKHTATTDVTLASPTGGVNGQRITVVVSASGATRLVSFPGGTIPSVSVPSGSAYVADLLYDSATDEWRIVGDGSGGGSGGSPGALTDGSVTLSKLATTGTASSSTFLRGDGAWTALSGGGAVSSVNGQTGAVVLTPDSFADGTTNHVFTAADDTKLGGIATGATANSSDATLLARANHTGTQSADTLTDGTTNKAFTAVERTKLTGVATGATANSSDATLLARANHTGTQPIGTLTTTGTASASTFLRGDSAWVDPSLLAAPVHAVGNSGTALTIDASSTSGWVKTITLTANCTFTLTGATAGRATTLELVLTQDGTGSRAVTWPVSVRWSGGAATLSTTAGAVDRIVLTTYNGGTTWLADLVGKGYA